MIQLDHRNGIGAALGDVQRCSSRESARLLGLLPLNPRGFGIRPSARLLETAPSNRSLSGIHDGDRIAVVAGHVSRVPAPVEDHLLGEPRTGDARRRRALAPFGAAPARPRRFPGPARSTRMLYRCLEPRPKRIFAARHPSLPDRFSPDLRSSSAIFARDPRSTTLIESFS